MYTMSSQDYTQDLDNFKIKKPNTGLQEQIAQKKALDEAVLAKIFNSKRETSPQAIAAPVTLNEEVARIKAVPPPPSSSINGEFEPKSIAWRQTTIQQLLAIYPAKHAISDVIMMVNGALQQPNTSYSLLGPKGTKLLLKSDNGQLFLAEPDPDGKAFANIGLSPDFDQDSTDDKDASNRMKPLQGTTPITTVKHLECNEFGLQEGFNEQIEEAHKIETESIKDPKVKSVVEKLRAMAADLRSGKRQGLDEDAVPSMDIRTVNNALFVAQSLYNKGRNALYDDLADELSDIIAECLLANKTSVSYSELSSEAKNFIESL